jgi:gamma-glutamylputrescine oxidase
MSLTLQNEKWGLPPWHVDYRPAEHDDPQRIDFAVIGGGFSGLSAAAWLKRLARDKSVALFEAARLGSGASGRTGGMTLAETAAGDLPGLGDVLAGFSAIVRELEIDCDLLLGGAWEIGRAGGKANSPIAWEDSGTLRVVNELPGGTVDPGKLVSGLARAAERSGVKILENAGVTELRPGARVTLTARGKPVSAKCVLVATNAEALDLADVRGEAEPRLTMALVTEPLDDRRIEGIGLRKGKPFYTVDFPYLWGRLVQSRAVVFGSGLVEVNRSEELYAIDVREGRAAERLAWLEQRVHGLHPELRDVRITHRWGGPILFTEGAVPIFRRRGDAENVLTLCGYSGHGVALSVYLGKWAAEAMLGRRALPEWTHASRAAQLSD